MTGSGKGGVEQDELYAAVQARLLGSSASNMGGNNTVFGSNESEMSKKQQKKLQQQQNSTKMSKEEKAALQAQWASGGGAKKEKKKEGTGNNKEDTKEVYVNKTPKGHKKILDKEMAKQYSPEQVESAWNDWWCDSGFFTPDASKSKGYDEKNRFIMVIPPPNVTGSLHLGHAITSAIEDCLTRWHRQCVHVTLWLPGTDHAGIATQSVVERMILKNEGKTRHDYGRENFLKKVWGWKTQYGNKICDQIRRLGASVDWTREAFTMDAKLSKAVKTGFIEFYRQGLIYRDTSGCLYYSL